VNSPVSDDTAKLHHHRHVSTTQTTPAIKVPPAAPHAPESYEFLIPILLWGLIIAGWIFLSPLKHRRIHRRNRGQRPEIVLNIIAAILKIFNILCLWPFKLLIGRCWYCGGWGHHQGYCPKKRQCWNCEEIGHHASRCQYTRRA
jgi:hypothetical protein